MNDVNVPRRSIQASHVYTMKVCRIELSGDVGYWLCTMLISGSLVWLGTSGSAINLALITVERYLRIVHPIFSKKRLRPWVICSGMTFAWLSGILFNLPTALKTSGVVDGVCYGYAFFKSHLAMTVLQVPACQAAQTTSTLGASPVVCG